MQETEFTHLITLTFNILFWLVSENLHVQFEEGEVGMNYKVLRNPEQCVVVMGETTCGCDRKCTYSLSRNNYLIFIIRHRKPDGKD